jgi:hypothetical protein
MMKLIDEIDDLLNNEITIKPFIVVKSNRPQKRIVKKAEQLQKQVDDLKEELRRVRWFIRRCGLLKEYIKNRHLYKEDKGGFMVER